MTAESVKIVIPQFGGATNKAVKKAANSDMEEKGNVALNAALKEITGEA